MLTANQDELGDSLEVVEMSYFLDTQGLKYREVLGTRGLQLLVKDCPVCGSSGWKVYLNKDTGLGNCNAGGHPVGENFNKWKFIRAVAGDNHSAVAIIKQMALELGWRPKAKKPAAALAPPSDVIMPQSIELPYEGDWMPPYLTDRGIGPELAAHFGLRWSAFGLYLYDDLQGVTKSQNYEQRVIIPVHGIDGRLESFQGRDATGFANDKYLFPPGLRGAGSLIYNAHRAVGAHDIVINEGVFDVIAAQSAFWGTPGTAHVACVGTFGVSVGMGEERSQLETLTALKQAGGRKWVFMWDGALSALERALYYGSLLRRRDFDTYLACLPLDKDPNEVSPAAVVEAYWRAQRITPELEMQFRLRYGL